MTARDAAGRLIPRRPLIGELSIAQDATSFFVLHEVSTGRYAGTIRSTLAGRGLVQADDFGCGRVATRRLTVVPGAPKRIALAVTSPRAAPPFDRAGVTARVLDTFGNIEPRVELKATASAGSLDPVALDSTGTARTLLSWDDTGSSTLRIADGVSGLSVQRAVVFPSAAFACAPIPPVTRLGAKGTVFSLPLVLAPPADGVLGGYRLAVSFDPSRMAFLGADGFAPFAGPVAEHAGAGSVLLTGRFERPTRTGGSPVAMVHFRALSAGTGSTRVGGVLLDEQQNEIPGFVPSVPCTFRMVSKPLNVLCVNVVVQKGAYADEATARDEVARQVEAAQAIYHAQLGHCCPDIMLKFDKAKDVSVREWKQGDNAAPTDKLEAVTAGSQTGGWVDKRDGVPCINVFVARDLPDPLLGMTWAAVGTACNADDAKELKETAARLRKAIDEFEKAAGSKATEDEKKTLATMKVVIDDATNHPTIIMKPSTARQTLAHELGHLLGLPHEEADDDNLMYPTAGGGEELTQAQCACVTAGKKAYEEGKWILKGPPGKH